MSRRPTAATPSVAPRAARPLTPRHWLLALSLGATVGASLWVSQLPADDLEGVDLARPRRPTSAASAAPAATGAPGAGLGVAPAARWALLPREPWPAPDEAALAAWQPPAPPAPPPSAAAVVPATLAPQAPPFPYQLIGRLVEASGPQALLGAEQRSLAVKVGDTIDGQWRVQAIGDESLELLWLPSQLPQTLRFKPL